MVNRKKLFKPKATIWLAGITVCFLSTAWAGAADLFDPGAPGQQMLVRQINLSLGQVPTRYQIKPKRDFEDFLIGPHLSITDMPFGHMLVLVEAVRAPESPISQGLLQHLRESGSNSVRLYDGYWWNPLGPLTTYSILSHYGYFSLAKAQKMSRGTHYTDARAVFDYLSRNGFDVVLTVGTIYYDPEAKKVYTTRQVADDVDGVLAKAAERNGATLARWWKEHGHGRRLVLEIGNEGIGYSKDPGPKSHEQYGRMVVAYTKAIKKANPEVEVALVLHGGENPNNRYTYGDQFRRILAASREVAPLMDHVIVHFYATRNRDWGLSYPNDTTRHLDLVTADLKANGYDRTRILITEYNYEIWSGRRDKVNGSVAGATRQIAIASHPRVSGLFIHQAPNYSLFSYSDGSKWTMSLPGGLLSKNQANRHIPDSRGKQLGPRFRMLPTGYTQQLLARTCRGKMLDAYAMDNYGQLGYLITSQADRLHIMVANTQPKPLQVQIPELQQVEVAIFRGKAWDSGPSDELQQPYGITNSRPAQNPTHLVAPPFSVLFIEGTSDQKGD